MNNNNSNVDKILISHGSGGKETSELIKDIFCKYLSNDILIKMEDAAIISLNGSKKIAFTTDSFTVTPLFFNGGDIGKLSIAGTVNDLSVMGAKPLFLSLSLIIEEGFLISDLKKIILSIKNELEISGAKIITGDTKVVPKGKADGIFINTAGIGEVLYNNLSASNINDGDIIIVSGEIGDHGAAIMSLREGIDIDTGIKSDCASLWGMIDNVLKKGLNIKAIRDATRGGLAAVLNEWAISSDVNIFIDEEKIPIKDNVKGFCEFIGLEPYQFACEGRALFAVDGNDADNLLKMLISHPLGEKSRIIGYVSDKHNNNNNNNIDNFKKYNNFNKKVIIKNIYGIPRFLDIPSGEFLPRIC
ncbi:MAG: hydrogenase expression/formation protein HypE [Candidatus Acididesulfobacter diazotrophicus]|jgi:hydrogenase expression/formation protein HypE|uniref:Hydrogenase expression/formation protein HypE n=1 Tax=Candidatus Acididesulfobacter diazotrophicus TaxID=2597226 RepID=A0A519BJY6_9DELT|nr:MAG: hydrogenase expression/formation protein HypE [Candidatus Acididesulfobacter diazotrophicus]